MFSKATDQMTILSDYNSVNLPVDRSIIFSSNKNEYKKRIEKRQTDLLKKLPFLKRFLDEDETIYQVATGCSPTSTFEQLLTGWIYVYLKRSLLVFTNKRIFHIPTKSDYSYRNSIAQVKYVNCKSIILKGRNLIINYKTGLKEKFLYISGKEKKKIATILSSISFEGQLASNEGRVHLCPRCRHKLEEGKYSCPNCSLEFKRRDEARKISIIYPGGGYFYTRHPWLGVSDAFAETILLILLIFSFVDFINGVPDSGFFLVWVAILFLIEKLTSIYHSNHFVKEYIPIEKEIIPLA
jgi:hypothetical protein